MTFDFTKIRKSSSSFELRTWDPEAMILYGNTNSKDDWFVLGLRDGRSEIQLHNQFAQLTVGAGLRLDDGRWHQVEIKILGDSLLLSVDGEEVLCLRQVSGPLASTGQPIFRIALGGLLFPASSLHLPLVPALDSCLRRGSWLCPYEEPQKLCRAVPAWDVLPSRDSGRIQSPRHSPASCRALAGSSLWTWDSSWQQALAPSLPLGPQKTLLGSSLLQDQKVLLFSGSGPGLDLPLVLGLPLQLKLAASGVVLRQGSKEILALPALDFAPLLKLWVWPQGRLFLGALPGETSASFCLDGLWAQGQKLDMDWALSRSQDIWTHSCPQGLNNKTDTTH